MKKLISMLLVVLMLTSLCANAFAAEMISTPDLIMEHMEERDDRAQTAEEQAVNGVYCLAEMLGAAAAVRATDEEYDSINACLEQLFDEDAQTLGDQQSLALGAMQVFNILEIIAEQEDPDMKYQSNRDRLREYFDEGDEEAGIAKQQTVNALFSAVYMVALIMEEICPTEEMVATIQAEFDAFEEDNDVCQDTDDQIVTSAYWLQRMLTGLVTLIAPGDDYRDAAIELSNENTKLANSQPSLETELVVWLYSCVQVSELFAQELLAEAE